MSSTNKTATIELSQYIGTDKPTYLTDYNGDMLKIDNAIAADRDSISTVSGVADGADRKADANKDSIDTLNEQMNGDPEVPGDSGLAGAVRTNTSSINTINELLGNGTPTAGDHTVIGAINANTQAIEGLTPGGGVTSETLAALGTSVEFDVPTTGDNLISFFSSDGSNYTALDDSVTGKVTLTYEAKSSARTIWSKIEEVTVGVMNIEVY